ncbi:LexA family transcriptional regulator [Xenophilus sp. Marseille-Q4582]|uniref:LexA family protein n=1 Tax=Xenophilus sp. Marseille-Q4582 TaxID=2866600 RepID=UPI00272CE9B9|nr:S24 family peptidase [Xenophilus sp. Marseille-Q4582]
MLTGIELGRAIAEAIEKKGVQKVDVAQHFGVKPPSIQDWINRGTISKGKLPKLWAYFADVAGPSHWGLESFPGDMNAKPVSGGKRPYPVISAVQAGLVKEISDPYAPGDGFDIEYGDDDWSKWTFVLELEGKSMEPDFLEGDRVFIDPHLAPRAGDFVVAKNHKQEATFKKYRLRGVDLAGQDLFDLVPLNPDYPTISSAEHKLTVIGVMVEHRRKYRRPKEH